MEEQEITYLFYDVESTGTNNRKDRIVQIAAVLTDYQGKELESYCTIIKPDDFKIPIGATNIHGITTQQALKEGIPLADALVKFSEISKKAYATVAHNRNFDKPFINQEWYRCELDQSIIQDNFMSLPDYCTMLSTCEFVGIENYYGYKWPKLSELYYKLFKEDFEGAHDALIDVRATIKCFFELKNNHGFFSTALFSELPF